MKLPLYQVDAFTSKQFSGNPACVVPLKEWPQDQLLLEIAKENAVAETAFFIQRQDRFHLRWFTPEVEMDLCGHATLATSHVIKEHLGFRGEKILFESLSGLLEVVCTDGSYTLDLPARDPHPADLPHLLRDSLSLQPARVLKARDYVLVYDTEEAVRNIRINRSSFDLLELGTGGVIVTAQGITCDFVSRFFTPGASVFEDPVTGSAHCSLVPYWSRKLDKQELYARQLSERGGELFCRNSAERVLISGSAVTYSVGHLYTS